MTAKNIQLLSLIITTIFSLSSCGEKKKSAAETERENWLLSLNDSIADYKSRIDEIDGKLSVIHSEIASMMDNFEHVSNPRLVEGYYIYRGWSSKYPISQTGIISRITQNEGFEIIAALSGSHFNQIRVNCGNISATSDVVPHDQALNYRSSTLNTVCFYGNAADSIGKLIADHLSENISLSYLDGNKTGSIILSAAQKEMIAATWQLFSAQKKANHMEREIPLLSRRIDLCRRMLEANDSTSN